MKARVSSNWIVDTSSLDGDGLDYGFVTLDPINPYGGPPTVNAIAGSYEFYRIVSMRATWVPIGGSQQTGHIASAFLSNPEIQQKYPYQSTAVRRQILESTQGFRFSAATGAYTHAFDSSNRVTSRRWYSNNSVATSISDFDSSIALTFVWGATGPPGSSSLGSWEIHAEYEFNSLSRSSLLTFALQAVAEPLRMPINASGGWPSQVVLVDRFLGDKAYLVPSDKPDTVETDA